jgi:catechol 2,3-dioxygenase-like lactoylglutathione lyase family enzyme
MAKATGVGGVFLKAKDPKALKAWYVEHLGVPEAYGAMSFEGPEAQGITMFTFFPETTGHFGGGEQRAMVNFRVDSMDELLAKLEAAGVRIDPRPEDESYGKFAWIWDPEGNRIELWEPA